MYNQMIRKTLAVLLYTAGTSLHSEFDHEVIAERIDSIILVISELRELWGIDSSHFSPEEVAYYDKVTAAVELLKPSAPSG